MSYVMPTRLTSNNAATTTPEVKVEQKVRVVDEVTVTPLPSTGRTHLLKPDTEWGWIEVRDYVVSEIEARHGVFPRDARREASIFQRFCRDYQDIAPVIARYAFEITDGWWKGSPISINRFCKGSDEWFAEVIIDRLLSD